MNVGSRDADVLDDRVHLIGGVRRLRKRVRSRARSMYPFKSALYDGKRR
jgi:hypothetical protein